MRSKLFYLTVIVIIIIAECFKNERISTKVMSSLKQQSETRLLAEFDSENDVKTVDILSLDTIRSTLVRQGTWILRT